ncbi:respiratory nitrate reductase subunit gamma [Marimonas lutisalis]|uniref:respiratory nitrate reductase subunit gamma n=1 Tax=Marimonas lutisalis TaxID=2545756 RepID=UPI0019615361|nr:respiratory nitrate reductase subunit gamma [Marimonas lutisalis]
MLSVIYAILFYVATILLVVGVAMKIRKYARTPAPLKIPTTPAPTTTGGVVLRMFREVVFFESLFKSNKWIWLFGWAFHMGMWLVLIRHIRYFTYDIWWWVQLAQPFGTYASFAMLGGLLGLWARRILVERIRYITNPSDHLMLALLVAIVGSGMMMRFVVHTDILAVKAFMLGLMRLRIETLPGDPILLVHLGAVAVLMIIFPISKLLHAPGVFFSPSRNQVDNPREVRHIAPWAKKLES